MPLTFDTSLLKPAGGCAAAVITSSWADVSGFESLDTHPANKQTTNIYLENLFIIRV
jgi:hypothetical protein